MPITLDDVPHLLTPLTENLPADWYIYSSSNRTQLVRYIQVLGPERIAPLSRQNFASIIVTIDQVVITKVDCPDHSDFDKVLAALKLITKLEVVVV